MATETDKILNVNEVLKTIGVAKMTLYQMMKKGHFPHSVQISVGRVGWRASDVSKWFKNLPHKREADGVDA